MSARALEYARVLEYALDYDRALNYAVELSRNLADDLVRACAIAHDLDSDTHELTELLRRDLARPHVRTLAGLLDYALDLAARLNRDLDHLRARAFALDGASDLADLLSHADGELGRLRTFRPDSGIAGIAVLIDHARAFVNAIGFILIDKSS